MMNEDQGTTDEDFDLSSYAFRNARKPVAIEIIQSIGKSLKSINYLFDNYYNVLIPEEKDIFSKYISCAKNTVDGLDKHYQIRKDMIFDVVSSKEGEIK